MVKVEKNKFDIGDKVYFIKEEMNLMDDSNSFSLSCYKIMSLEYRSGWIYQISDNIKVSEEFLFEDYESAKLNLLELIENNGKR